MKLRPGITSKLFLALFALSLVAVLAMSIASRFSFTRGFVGYLNDQGVERMEVLLPTVAAAYEERGDWEFLRGRPRAWIRILRQASGIAEPQGDDLPPTPPSAATMSVDLRIALFDADGSYVVGNPDAGPDAVRRAILVDGSVVGWLAAVPFEQIGGGADQRFEQRQQRMTWLIAAATMVLAGVLAFWLARRLVTGLRRLTGSVNRIAAGDYSVRVAVPARDELGTLARDINRLASALSETEQMRRSFMADISHELRTPLAVLRGELEALEDGMRQPTIESIRSLQAEVGKLSKLVDDLYSLSLSDAGTLAYRFGDVDLGEALQTAIDSVQNRFADRRLRVEAEGLSERPHIAADPDRLQQLFGNILENTIRYTASDGLLRVACRTDGESAIIDFQDSAPGVPSELLPRLFERFYRVESSRNRATGGSGLGLAICKSIVGAHGGNISARPSPLGGLWISVSLPLSRP